MIRTVQATRYVTPLREGGSLPAVVEASDEGMYVVKFRGAAQGIKSLVAELIAGEIGRLLGLPVPEIVFIEVDAALSRSEPHAEIQALLKASSGLNLALDYLPGSLNYDPLHPEGADNLLASKIVWFDSYITNVDRTPRNTNMLVWHKKLWLIDHGASLYFHHNWADYEQRSRSPFAPIKDHVLLYKASRLAEADELLKPLITRSKLQEILAAIPDEWLEEPERREDYLNFLLTRLENSSIFVQEAQNARSSLL